MVTNVNNIEFSIPASKTKLFKDLWTPILALVYFISYF